MRILSVETSCRTASLATHAVDRGGLELIREVALAAHLRTAQGLAPQMKEVLAESGWRPADVTLVAVSIGPGSFTGLRIGVTAAKTFAYAVGAAILGIPTLRVIAEQARVECRSRDRGTDVAVFRSGVICPVVRAERGQVFAGRYEMTERGVLAPICDVQVLNMAAWEAWLEPGDIVTGPALSKLAPRLSDRIHRADMSVWQPCARTVGELAWRDFAAGRRDDLWQIVPNYCRLSAAEEKTQRNGG